MAQSDSFYQELITEVNDVIDEFGTSYTVRAPGTYDSDELETTVGPTRQVDGIVADQKFSNSMFNTSLAMNEERLTWVAKKSLILKADANPLAGEEILVDGKWFPLAKLSPIKPADVVVVYMLDVSK